MTDTCKNPGTCGDKTKGCFCYAVEDDPEPMKNQFCGYEGTDGTIYGCDPGCCSAVCPSKTCPRIPPRKPEKFAPKPVDNSKTPTPLPQLLKLLLILLLVLLSAALVFTFAEK